MAKAEILEHKKNRKYGAPFLCFRRIILAFMMRTLQKLSSFVKMVLKWKDVSSIAFPICKFLGFQTANSLKPTSLAHRMLMSLCILHCGIGKGAFPLINATHDWNYSHTSFNMKIP